MEMFRLLPFVSSNDPLEIVMFEKFLDITSTNEKRQLHSPFNPHLIYDSEVKVFGGKSFFLRKILMLDLKFVS